MFLKNVRNKINFLINLLKNSSLSTRRSHYEALRKMRLDRNPKNLSGYGYKVLSQSDEDGILNEIFRRIGITNRIFVEFGVGEGLENNTVALLFSGWSGLWIEGSPLFYNKIKNEMAELIDRSVLKVVNEFIYSDNINTLISTNLQQTDIDLLSVDIDGNDAHVIDQIKCINPRVIVVEYNAKFGPSIEFCMKYDPDYIWKKSDNFGASLKYYEKMMRSRGYSLVGCNIVGTNAFFVRNDLLNDSFEQPYTSEHHFEPARYELVGLPSGHPTTYKILQAIV